MADKAKIQWHPAFCSAMELTLWDDHDSLSYRDEFPLSRLSLKIDLLVIHKMDDKPVKDVIGRIFRQYNILEYKSPGDGLNIDTYYKVVGYGCLYKSLKGMHVNEIHSNEITLTLMRREKPAKLFVDLAEDGITASNDYPGIYHLHGSTAFETQVIVTEELPKESYIWLRALTKDLDVSEAAEVLNEMARFPEESKERGLSDSVLQVTMSANYETFEDLKKEDPVMCDALRQLMKPEMDEAVDKAIDNNKIATAERMIRTGKLSEQEIADYTGLTIEQVQHIKNEMFAAV